MSVKDTVRPLLGRGDRSLEQKEAVLGYLLVGPAILLVASVIVYPVLYNIYLSFTTVPLDPDASPVWVGLEHYRTLFASAEFWAALKNTVVFTLASDLLATGAGLGVALLFNRKFRGRRIARGLMLLPYVAPLIAVAYIWQWLLDPLYGLLPWLFSDVIPLYDGQTDVLNDAATALWAVILFDAWRYFPFAFLMIIARVQSIPSDMYEAAKIDGAGTFARFKDITLPELKYVLATVFLLRWIWNFNKFADIWLLTRQVNTLPLYAYQTAFANFRMGEAAAVSMVLFVALLGFVFVYVGTVLEW